MGDEASSNGGCECRYEAMVEERRRDAMVQGGGRVTVAGGEEKRIKSRMGEKKQNHHQTRKINGRCETDHPQTDKIQSQKSCASHMWSTRAIAGVSSPA